MAQVLEIECTPDLFDWTTGADCTTEKVVDITEDCPSAEEDERTVLLFTRGQRGRIVEIKRVYKGVLGSYTHFFVDELDREIAPRHDTFASIARQLGLTKLELRVIIKAQAPV